MNREELLGKICYTDYTSECSACDGRYNCSDCKDAINPLLDEYDRQIRVGVIGVIKAYVSKKADEMNMRTKYAEEKADMMSENYFSGAMWHLMEVKEFLEQLKEQNK